MNNYNYLNKMNNNLYTQNYLQTPMNIIYNSKASNSPQNSIRNYTNLNNYSSSISSIPLSFNIPKQTSFLNYQPSTPTKKKNIINLNDNSKLKRYSDMGVIYKKLYTFDSLDNYNNYNSENLRYGSPPPNKNVYNNDKYILPNIPSQSNINLDEKIFRMAKTPEPKKINYNEYHSQNQYNINIFVNNSNNYKNSFQNQNYQFGSPKKIKQQSPYLYKSPSDNNNIKIQNNIHIKKLNDVNYNSFSNSRILSQINSTSNIITNTNIQMPQKIYNYNSPIRRNHITLSPEKNSHFYNSPPASPRQNNFISTNNKINNYYNSPIRLSKPENNIVQNNISNNLFSPERNNLYNTSYNNINSNNKINYQTNEILSNNYVTPKLNNSPMDNMKQKPSQIQKNYNRIKSDNYIKRIIPPKIIQNRVNLIPIPKKIISDNSIDNRSFSNFLNLSTNQNYSAYNNQANIMNNNIKKIQVNQSSIQQTKNNSFLGPLNTILNKKEEPTNDFNPREFKIIKKLGEGTFGKIYAIKWLKTNELFALKKMDLCEYDVYVFKKKVRIIQNFIKSTNHNGLIKIYGDKCIPRQKIDEFYYYAIMELAETDLEKEINKRKSYNRFYTEEELLNFILQLVKTLALMEKNSITHRDVKPQNILLTKGLYKLCDFGETKIISGIGPILQAVRGSELYMSPILFYAYNRNVPNVLHNTYKSDVFSLGMCALLVASLSVRPLCDIREIKNMVTIETIIINNLVNRYSKKMINLILKMLEIDETLRMDFIQLEEYISNVWPDKEYYFK